MLDCEPIDGVLGLLSSNQINIPTFVPEIHTSPIWWTKVAIFI